MADRIEQRRDGWWVAMPPYFDQGPFANRELAEARYREVRAGERRLGMISRQQKLFDGLNCEPGQLDLF